MASSMAPAPSPSPSHRPPSGPFPDCAAVFLPADPPRAGRVAFRRPGPGGNDLSELWTVLDWAAPGLLSPLGTFRMLHADTAERAVPASGAGAPAPDAAERLARLVRPFLLRRRKGDPGIAPGLPPETETDRAVAPAAEQAGLHEAVVREGPAGISGADGVTRRGRRPTAARRAQPVGGRRYRPPAPSRTRPALVAVPEGGRPVVARGARGP